MKGDSKFATEKDLAAAIVVYLEELQWDIFQEVQGYSAVADIVGEQNGKLVVVETKKALTFDVIAQALRWKGSAHQVFVAVPKVRCASDGRHLAYRVCRERGIGVLEAERWPTGPHVTEQVPAEERVKIDAKGLKDRLRPEHKTFAKAGTAGGGHWTPFKQTVEALRREITRGAPGRTLIEVVKGLDHHYASPSSARNHLGDWIERGKVPGVSLETQDGKTIVVYSA